MEDSDIQAIEAYITSMHPTRVKRWISRPTDKLEPLSISDEAIDIIFICPHCHNPNETVWVFPDTPMMFECRCCGKLLLFRSYTL